MSKVCLSVVIFASARFDRCDTYGCRPSEINYEITSLETKTTHD